MSRISGVSVVDADAGVLQDAGGFGVDDIPGSFQEEEESGDVAVRHVQVRCSERRAAVGIPDQANFASEIQVGGEDGTGLERRQGRRRDAADIASQGIGVGHVIQGQDHLVLFMEGIQDGFQGKGEHHSFVGFGTRSKSSTVVGKTRQKISVTATANDSRHNCRRRRKRRGLQIHVEIHYRWVGGKRA